MQEASGRIKIIAVPSGEAPFTIRSAWVGLELPCDPTIGYSGKGSAHGVLSGKPIDDRQRSACVPQVEALQILEAADPIAAAFWREIGFPLPGTYFRFREDEVQIISGVTFQQLVLVPDEAQGQSSR